MHSPAEPGAPSTLEYLLGQVATLHAGLGQHERAISPTCGQLNAAVSFHSSGMSKLPAIHVAVLPWAGIRKTFAHVLAVCSEDEELTPAFLLRFHSMSSHPSFVRLFWLQKLWAISTFGLMRSALFGVLRNITRGSS
jgi:hypothetical protein